MAVTRDVGAGTSPPSIERHGYAPPANRRWTALAVISCIYAMIAAGLFLSFETSSPPPKPAAPLVVSLLPLSSPPEAPPTAKGAAKVVEQRERKPTPPKIEPVTRMIVPVTAVPAPQPLVAVQPIATQPPTPPQAEPAAPRTVSAPPAPRISSNAPDSWEGRVLARLQRYQRYPSAARRARQQGVAYVRFRVNRDGHVLSSELARGSGYAALDQAALETLSRADPFSGIPPDRPNELEIVVPVEFTIR